MNGLTPRECELVALGAAMGSNCVPCIEHHIPEARRAGLSDAELGEAIELADRVRRVPARKVLSAANAALAPTAAPTTLPEAARCADMSHHASSCC